MEKLIGDLNYGVKYCREIDQFGLNNALNNQTFRHENNHFRIIDPKWIFDLNIPIIGLKKIGIKIVCYKFTLNEVVISQYWEGEHL